MKKTVASAILATSFSIVAGMASADSGNLTFDGEITQSACSIGGGQQGSDIVVPMGSISTNEFGDIGSRGPDSKFTIALLGCDPSVAGTAAISFRPSAGNVVNNRLLSLENGSGASGVAIGLAQDDGTAIPVGGSPVSYTLLEGSNILTFRAFYESTNTVVTPGRANARAVFEVNYS